MCILDNLGSTNPIVIIKFSMEYLRMTCVSYLQHMSVYILCYFVVTYELR